MSNFPCKSKGIRLRAGSCGGCNDDDDVEDDDGGDDDDDDDEEKRATTTGLLRVRKTLRGSEGSLQEDRARTTSENAAPFGTPNV